jgi:hypothetical protein
MAKRTRVWRNPADIAQQNQPLNLDAEIRSASLQDRWSVDDAIRFGRHALVIALKDAISGESERSRQQYDDWERTADLAKAAYDAVRKLTTKIGPKGLPIGISMGSPVRVSKALAKSGKLSVRIGLRESTDGTIFSPSDAQGEAEKLASCCALLKKIHEHASSRTKSLSHTRINDSDYAKRAFVYRLAEAWIFLTGRPPRAGRTPAKNQFLRFVGAAAIDAGLPDEDDFYSALVWTLRTLHAYEGMSGMSVNGASASHQSISGIIVMGPAWAEGY